MMLNTVPAPKAGRKLQLVTSTEIQQPYWVEMIYDLVNGAGFSYSRIAYRIKVSPSTIQKLATQWERKPRYQVFHRLLVLYHKVFQGSHVSHQAKIFWDNKQ